VLAKLITEEFLEITLPFLDTDEGCGYIFEIS